MKRPFRAGLASLAIIVLILFVARMLSRQPAEPAYLGKPLDRWLVALDPARAGQPGRSQRDARRALREIGTNAFPVLFRLLRATDSPLKIRLVALLAKQHFIHPNFTTASNLHQEAQAAFSYLGVRAENALPELVKMSTEDPSPQVRSAAASTVSTLTGQIRISGNLDQLDRQTLATSYDVLTFSPLYPHSHSQTPVLFQLLTNLNINSYWVKFRLEEIDPDAYHRAFPDETTASGIGAGLAANESKDTALNSPAAKSPRVAAVGGWSASVRDSHNYLLHGRLLLDGWTATFTGLKLPKMHAAVHLELQDLSSFIASAPDSVCSDLEMCVQFEVHDPAGNIIPCVPSPAQSAEAAPVWYTLPPDGTVVFGADAQVSSGAPSVVTLSLGRQSWEIPAGATNFYLLSGIFNPPSNHPNPLDYAVWDGTLKLPPVRIQFPIL